MRNNNTYKHQLQRGCTSHRGIGLRDIARIRETQNMPHVKPHMAGAALQFKNM